MRLESSVSHGTMLSWRSRGLISCHVALCHIMHEGQTITIYRTFPNNFKISFLVDLGIVWQQHNKNMTYCLHSPFWTRFEGICFLRFFFLSGCQVFVCVIIYTFLILVFFERIWNNLKQFINHNIGEGGVKQTP